MNAARAIIRLAWRNVWRDKRRNLTVAGLIALAVAAGAVMPTVARSTGGYFAEAQQVFGEGDYVTVVTGSLRDSDTTGASLVAAVEQQSKLMAPNEVLSTYETLSLFNDQFDSSDLLLVFPDIGEAAIHFRLTEGQLPAGPMEALAVTPPGMTAPILNSTRHTIGGADYVITGIATGSFRPTLVVATRPEPLPPSLHYFAISATTTAPPDRTPEFGNVSHGLVDGVATSSFSEARRTSQYFTPETEELWPILVAIPLVGVLPTAVLSAYAMRAGTYRRLRQFGILGTTGASPRQRRAVVIAESTLIAGLGAIVGGAVGWLVTLWDSSWFWVPIETVAVVFVAFWVALFTAVAPTKLLKQTSVVQSLAGRVPPKPVRPIRNGIALGAAAVALIGIIGSMFLGRQASLAPVTLGAVLTFICLAGLAVMTVPAIARIAEGRDELPVSLRIVARDLGRHMDRTAEAVLLLTVIVALSTVTITLGVFDRTLSDALFFAVAGSLGFGLLLYVTSKLGVNERDEDVATMRSLGSDSRVGRRYAAAITLLTGTISVVWGGAIAATVIPILASYDNRPTSTWPLSLALLAVPPVISALVLLTTRSTSVVPKPRTQ